MVLIVTFSRCECPDYPMDGYNKLFVTISFFLDCCITSLFFSRNCHMCKFIIYLKHFTPALNPLPIQCNAQISGRKFALLRPRFPDEKVKSEELIHLALSLLRRLVPGVSCSWEVAQKAGLCDSGWGWASRAVTHREWAPPCLAPPSRSTSPRSG